ncbi:MAG: hypothetical protein COA92_07360 [Sulfurovum sp.]|nr:MAG: hypothetical protein COA92_07360 [Sulfurovum sp.]
MNFEINQFYKSIFTLKYDDKKMEVGYLESIFNAKQLQMLFIMGLTFFIYLLYIILDFLILNEQERSLAVPFHITMLILWVYLISSIYYNFFRKFAMFILYLMPIYAVLGTLVFSYYYNPVYVVEIYVILFWTFVTIGYMFLTSVIVASIMAMSSAVILYAYNIIEHEAYILHMFLMVVAWMLGLSASYLIELYSRDNYEKKLAILHMQDELKELSHRDYLTNLYNRRYFNEFSKKFLNNVKQESEQMSVIMLDIDFFKNINDTYGHAIGDEIIKLLASLLKDNTRESDIVFRLGGEEFAILLPSTGKEKISNIAEKLRVVIENKEFRITKDKSIRLTVSLGVACVNFEKDHNMSESLNRADKVLYQAKAEGRNRVVIDCDY